MGRKTDFKEKVKKGPGKKTKKQKAPSFPGQLAVKVRRNRIRIIVLPLFKKSSR
jgi:hypothetical protein